MRTASCYVATAGIALVCLTALTPVVESRNFLKNAALFGGAHYVGNKAFNAVTGSRNNGMLTKLAIGGATYYGGKKLYKYAKGKKRARYSGMGYPGTGYSGAGYPGARKRKGLFTKKNLAIAGVAGLGAYGAHRYFS